MTIDSKKKFMINALFVAFVAILVYFVLKYLTVWLLPFVIGFLFSLILQRPVAWLTKKTRVPRAIWSFVLVFFILCFVFGLIFFVGYRIYQELYGLVSWMTDSIPALKEAFGDISQRFSGWLDRIPASLADAIRNSPAAIAEKGVAALSNAVTSFAKVIIVNVPSLLITTIISIIASCFITNDYNRITQFILCQFSQKVQHVIRKSKHLFMENIVKMFRGYLLIMTITFVELFFGFLIIKIPYAAIVAVIIAILDILPVLGTGTVLIPWAIIDIIIGKPILGLEILALYGIITIIRNIIEPKIIGKQVGLPAIVTLMAMYLGLQTLGFVGMFGFPIMIIIVAKLQESGLIKIWKTIDVPPSLDQPEKTEE